jgi:DNA (cytosine-5)-methyltransferase 1
MKINYLDLFSGIGGFTLGLLQAGFEFSWHGYSEVDIYANEIYRKRFPNAKELGDVKKIHVGELPKLDLISFGWPCQDISIAGHRGGLEAARSGLFYEAIKIIGATKPTYFIAENVKGLFSSNNGADFIIVLQQCAKIGYDVQWQLLNTKWVLPQHRERVYIVGHFREEPRPKIFPIGESDCRGAATQKKTTREGARIRSENNPSVVPAVTQRMGAETIIVPTISSRYYKGGMGSEALLRVGQLAGKGGIGQRVYDSEGIAKTLHGGGGGQGGKTGLYLDPKDDIRRLTPLECERLQGFPDGWTKELSDTRRYKTLGNAVSVPLVKIIATKLKEELNGRKHVLSYTQS